MKRHVCTIALALVAGVALAAQAPEGWRMRVDRSMSASDPDAAGDITFMKHGSMFHAVNPQAAVYWNPANTASGSYTLKGSFKLVRPADHNNYYGLVFGGSALEGADQSYVYFMVSQNGTYLIKRRHGDTTENVTSRTLSEAIMKPDASGTSTNVLEVRVSADAIDYVVNGTVVHTTPKTGLTATTDGTYGIRVNHHLEVQIDDFGLSKPMM